MQERYGFFIDRNLLKKVAKVFASKLFNIVWLRLVTKSGLIFTCFFYVPGAHHGDNIRIKS